MKGLQFYMRTVFSSISLGAGLLVVASMPALADDADEKSYESKIYVNPFFISDADRDLGTREGGKSDEFGIIVKPWLKMQFSEHWSGLIYGQAFYSTDTVDIDSEEGGDASDGFVGLRELWLDWNGLTDYPGESIRLGRERLQYDDGIWIDTDITLLRWRWDTTLFDATAGVAEKLSRFRSDDSELSDDEKDLLRLFASGRWQYQRQHFADLRVLHTEGRDDSPTEPSLTWVNLGFDSQYMDYRARNPFAYTVDLFNVSGDEELAGSRQSVNGWAADLGIRWRPSGFQNFALGAHYAIAPGDEDGGFRQSGLESNRSAFTGTRAKFHRFNEALKATLYNIEVMTAYVSYSDMDWDVSLVYQQFRLDDPTLGVFIDGISLAPTALDDDLGSGLDLVTSVYWPEEAPMFDGLAVDSYLRLRLSGFQPGDAYANGDLDDLRYRATFDWVMRF
ncbi:alginate export family protein [Hahella ganghwensis]|uniref:alginate export family protein n=1 Tax=Hahella ganghwensis TaxID=286420 RepID=UPI000361F7A1|nr:alginate export family protein [Hahella ganghwensis]